MKCKFACLFIVLLAGDCLAGYQVRQQICRLSVQRWGVTSRDGQVGLDESSVAKWQASAPTITDATGRFISGDPTGKEPTLQLVKEKGPHANWAFEFTKRTEPGKAGADEGRGNSNLLVGERGFTFKMKLAEGPYKDWYVGVDPLPPKVAGEPNKLPEWRPLKLVKDVKEATEFDYHETHFEVGHK